MSEELKVVIVDDEAGSRLALRNMVTEFCRGVVVVAEADSVESAAEVIQKHQPDLVFLDIEMPEKNGFELFPLVENESFEVIFTTAYDQYAVKAFRMSAVDYLLKPIHLGELRQSIEKVREIQDQKTSEERIRMLQENLNGGLKKLVLPVGSGYLFVEIDQILRCKAESNYTWVYVWKEEEYLVAKTLKVYEELLKDYPFFRISRSDLINLDYIKRYERGRNPTVHLQDGTELPVAESRKQEFWNIISDLM
ncbi:MAG: LytTR family DNA-binding domain-containing protein [Bacteroidota bacterium]